MYCKCGQKLPEARVKMGYKTCVKCSTEEKWGCSQVVYHKTGNTIEVIKDKELCDQINAMAKRPAFGVCVGVKGTVKMKTTRNASPRKSVERQPALSFNQIGARALSINSEQDLSAVKRFLNNCTSKRWISQYSANRILSVVEALNNTK